MVRRPNAKPGEGLRWLDEALVGPLPADGCLTWPFGRFAGGYAETFVDGRVRYVHHLVLERTVGPRPPSQEAAHSCGRGKDACIDPRHLRWATAAENQAEQVGHGKSTRGERALNAKLTEVDVRAIRAIPPPWSAGLRDELAVRYGVSKWTIHGARYRHSWAWLAD